MKKILWIGIIGLGIALTGKAQSDTKPTGKFILGIEGSNRKIGVELGYVIHDRWVWPISIGVGNEFQEKKWNDWYIEGRPQYRFGQKKWRFPVGILGGIRLMKDYSHHFPVFYGGGFGGVLYRPRQHGIGVDVGVKYGKRYHLLRNVQDWGNVSAYETYCEKPLFFTIYYQFLF